MRKPTIFAAHPEMSFAAAGETKDAPLSRCAEHPRLARGRDEVRLGGRSFQLGAPGADQVAGGLMCVFQRVFHQGGRVTTM